MEKVVTKENNTIDGTSMKRILFRSSKIFIPLYSTYIVFIFSIFLIFIPQHEKQLLNQKKETIRQLTDNVISLLSEINLRVEQKKISLEEAREQAINQIRNLRYGPEGKDYFWINDMHPFMIVHPYRPDLEGKDLSLYKDTNGNYPFVVMVKKALSPDGGYVDYYWQWKDELQRIVPKTSYVKRFQAWDWIVGTGIYTDDINQEIKNITRKLLQIFGGILSFIVAISFYISRQIFRIEQRKDYAENIKKLEELRLKKLFELSQMGEGSIDTISDFALEEAINLTQSEIGYLAFLNENESQLTMHSWSKQAMKECEIDDKILIYNVSDAGLWAEAVRTRKVSVINDYKTFEKHPKKGFPQGHVKISRIMNVPIFDGNKMVALTGVGNKQEDYNDSDIRQLQLMMDGMWKILQRKRAEIELKKSEERYRLLADNARDTIWILKLSDLKVSYVSPAIKYLLGYTPFEFACLEMKDFLKDASMKMVLKIISEELDQEFNSGSGSKVLRTVELEMLKKDGQAIWVEITASFLADEKGEPDRILGISRDISERKHANDMLKRTTELLRESEAISAALFNQAFNFFGLLNLDGKILKINNSALNELKFDQELIGMSFWDAPWWPDKDEAHRIGIDAMKTAKGGAIYRKEVQHLNRDGDIRYVDLAFSPLKDDFGKVIYLIPEGRDVTGRKRMEDDLKRSTDLLKEAGRIAKVGGWTADVEKLEVVWSDEMFAIHDLDPGFSISFNDSDRYIAPEWREKIAGTFRHSIEEGVRLDEEFEILTAKGRRRWVRATGEAIRNGSGKITRLIGALQDISDRKQEEEEKKKLQEHLVQARKMETIGVLAGGIAHDFNNILSGIMGFTDLAMLEAGDNETLKKYLDQVSSSSLRARDLVKHILTFSRKADAKKVSLTINPVIKETLKFMRASLPANIEIRHDLRAEDAKVLCDSTQIHQILMNLFTNAGHAMKEKGGVLEVTLERVELEASQTGYFGKISPGAYFQLNISDTGCGISRNIVDRIFEPFFTTKEREEGTGMGLATVYGILKEMGGGISVYSEEGIGTTFKILMPEHNQSGTKESAKSILQTGQGNILVVDDEIPIVDSTCELLSRLGYTVTGETNGIKAVERVKNNPDFYDLILTDMTMPVINGLDLTKQIREINPKIPIVLCTGFSHGLTKEKCEGIGIADMVMKPLIAGELSSTVDKAINKKQKQGA
ncbi:MAG: cache domain-containing protein [Desulfobacteraceae bacterium]|nr:cache domain-containing protein [Desulfobacteraceae bacterium]